MDFLKLVTSLKILNIGIISFGDIIRSLLETDGDFAKKYRTSLARGDLIDDPRAIEIFQIEMDKIIKEKSPQMVIVDGFCRSVPQIGYAADNGYLSENSMVFMIEASLETCLERFLHRKKKSVHRLIDAEIETFHKRYHLHLDTAPALRAMFKETPCKLIDVNGEGEIPDHSAREIKDKLFPVFVSMAKKVMGLENIHA